MFATVNPLPNLAPTWNMAPTMGAPVAQRVDGERHLNALKLGLVPYFTKDLQKARKAEQRRSETVSKSGTFREAFAKRRCLVPAPVYYEWRDYPDGKTVRRLKWAHSGDHAIDGGGMSAAENSGQCHRTSRDDDRPYARAVRRRADRAGGYCQH